MSNKSVMSAFSPPQQVTDLHAEADRLTARLALFEEQLGSLPWKIACRVEAMPGNQLVFDRAKDKWRLQWRVRHEGGIEAVRNLLDCSIEIKSIAASLLPDLIEEMKSQYEARRVALLSGHQALDVLESHFSLARGPKEGA